jgi:hypothetical protein
LYRFKIIVSYDNRYLIDFINEKYNHLMMKPAKKLIERLDQAILDVIKNPKKTQKLRESIRYHDKRSKLLL